MPPFRRGLRYEGTIAELFYSTSRNGRKITGRRRFKAIQSLQSLDCYHQIKLAVFKVSAGQQNNVFSFILLHDVFITSTLSLNETIYFLRTVPIHRCRRF